MIPQEAPARLGLILTLAVTRAGASHEQQGWSWEIKPSKDSAGDNTPVRV